ncbi:gamma-glutamylcyclotransferase family protein [Actinomadura fibrosa]|uniref:Putative gamma-glutamylcyclotransferase n=1 Tax=Actinomadura fibrosa TaxID=111802 RepID=A0ABW2XJY9_9ACTN|nr:gamma-glutamylcyclotransferase family protein [Actinomadura fibrosa]
MSHPELQSPRTSSSQWPHSSATREVLFVYGTLQFPEVLLALIGRVPELEEAAAEGWRAATVPGHVYPALVRDRVTVPGYLLTGLSSDEWRLLDAFEGPMYELLRLELVDGRYGYTYACRSGVEVGEGVWSAEDFREHHLRAYVEQCAAWRWHYDVGERVGSDPRVCPQAFPER